MQWRRKDILGITSSEVLHCRVSVSNSEKASVQPTSVQPVWQSNLLGVLQNTCRYCKACGISLRRKHGTRPYCRGKLYLILGKGCHILPNHSQYKSITWNQSIAIYQLPSKAHTLLLLAINMYNVYLMDRRYVLPMLWEVRMTMYWPALSSACSQYCTETCNGSKAFTTKVQRLKHEILSSPNVGWDCILKSFLLSSLPCFLAFY